MRVLFQMQQQVLWLPPRTKGLLAVIQAPREEADGELLQEKVWTFAYVYDMH
jgi:hypothetical protein